MPSSSTANSARRQGGYGRGKRQTLETDRGHRRVAGHTTAMTTPVPRLPSAWSTTTTNSNASSSRPSPRGGHVDLALASINYQTGIRQVLERASARETAMRVAVGALGKLPCSANSGITVFGYVRETWRDRRSGQLIPEDTRSMLRFATPARSTPWTPPADASDDVAAIDAGQGERGDTLGGVVEAVVVGCPIGLGQSYPVGPEAGRPTGLCGDEHPGDQGGRDRARGRGGPPSRFGGDGLDRATTRTTRPDDRRLGFRRPRRTMPGGIEGGTSNGEAIVVRAAKKPISTLAARGRRSTWPPSNPGPPLMNAPTSAPCPQPA